MYLLGFIFFGKLASFFVEKINFIPMINVSIVDDDLLSRAILNNYTAENEYIRVLGVYDNAKDLIQSPEIKSVDVVFTDIQMPGIDGLELAKQLGTTPIVFTTAFEDYALQAFEFNVVDYLVKPITKDRFERTIKKILISLGKTESPLVFRIDRKNQKIFPSEIKYFQSEGDYVKIQMTKNDSLVHLTMKNLEESLPANFIRIHRKYIVNKNFVHSSNNSLVLIDDKEFPIGNSYNFE